jgi:hypothetical protein
MSMQQFHGSCHCGNIRFVFSTAKPASDLPKRECQCSFCRQHGRISTSDPDGHLRVIIDHEDNVSRYRFGHRTADFLVCRVCGLVPVVTSEVDGRTIGLVDVKMMKNFPWSRDELKAHDFDGETGENRMARREANWTRNVEFG